MPIAVLIAAGVLLNLAKSLKFLIGKNVVQIVVHLAAIVEDVGNSREVAAALNLIAVLVDELLNRVGAVGLASDRGEDVVITEGVVHPLTHHLGAIVLVQIMLASVERKLHALFRDCPCGTT